MKTLRLFLLMLTPLLFAGLCRPTEDGQYVAKQFTLNDLSDTHATNPRGCFLNRGGFCNVLDTEEKTSIGKESEALARDGWKCEESKNYSKEYPIFTFCQRDHVPPQGDWQIYETRRFYKSRAECLKNQKAFTEDSFKERRIPCGSDRPEASALQRQLKGINWDEYEKPIR